MGQRYGDRRFFQQGRLRILSRVVAYGHCALVEGAVCGYGENAVRENASARGQHHRAVSKNDPEIGEGLADCVGRKLKALPVVQPFPQKRETPLCHIEGDRLLLCQLDGQIAVESVQHTNEQNHSQGVNRYFGQQDGSFQRKHSFKRAGDQKQDHALNKLSKDGNGGQKGILGSDGEPEVGPVAE